MKITAAALVLTAVALIASADSSWGQTKLKAATNPAPKGGGDPGVWGQWIADVERPAAGKNKTPTITAKCHQPGSSRSVRC